MRLRDAETLPEARAPLPSNKRVPGLCALAIAFDKASGPSLGRKGQIIRAHPVMNRTPPMERIVGGLAGDERESTVTVLEGLPRSLR